MTTQETTRRAPGQPKSTASPPDAARTRAERRTIRAASARRRRSRRRDIAALLQEGRGRGRRAEGRLAARPGRHRERPQAGARPTSRKAHKYAIEHFAEDLLPVKDALEADARAPATRRPRRCEAGVELTLKQLAAAFDKAQVVEIDPGRREVRSASAPGDDDGRQPTSRRTPSSQVFQKGYLLNDRVLRPALVAVAKPRTRRQ